EPGRAQSSARARFPAACAPGTGGTGLCGPAGAGGGAALTRCGGPGGRGTRFGGRGASHTGPERALAPAPRTPVVVDAVATSRGRAPDAVAGTPFPGGQDLRRTPA